MPDLARRPPLSHADPMADDADRIISLYERHAHQWDKDRTRRLFEKPWLNSFLRLLPPGGSILDLGCGSGEPIARHFIKQGYAVTGVELLSAMIAMCKRRFREHSWLVADMRSLSLRQQFHGILAWDSFFHLREDDQRRMFPIFKALAGPSAALMFTSGPRHGVAIANYRGEPLYHSSLDPTEYRSLLTEHGFEVLRYVAEDPHCGWHTIWLARLSIGTGGSSPPDRCAI